LAVGALPVGVVLPPNGSEYQSHGSGCSSL
jgi:hypothetical protein